jgi:hypothetical protein
VAGPPRPVHVPCTGCVFLPAPSPCDRCYRLGVLRAGLTPSPPSASLLSFRLAYHSSIPADACPSTCFGVEQQGSPKFLLLLFPHTTLFVDPGRLRTPSPSLPACSCWLLCPLTPSPPASFSALLRGCIKLWGFAVSPAVCRMRCVRLNRFIRKRRRAPDFVRRDGLLTHYCRFRAMSSRSAPVVLALLRLQHSLGMVGWTLSHEDFHLTRSTKLSWRAQRIALQLPGRLHRTVRRYTS